MTHTFASVVEKSRVLTSEQKALFLEDPDSLPEGYQEKIVKLLTEFDDHSTAREQHLRQKLEEEFRMFAQRLEFEGIEERERKAMLAKARKQIEAFFPQQTSV